MTIIIDACVSKTHQNALSRLGYKVIKVNNNARDTTILLYALENADHGIIVTCDKNFSTVCNRVNVRNILLPNELNKDTTYLVKAITDLLLKESTKC